MGHDSPKHLAAIVRDFASYLIAEGHQQADVFQGTLLSLTEISEPEAMAPIAELGRVFDNGAALTGDDLIGIRWGLNRRFVQLGLVGYLGRSSMDVKNMLLNIARYRQVFSDPIDFDVSQLEITGAFMWSYNLPPRINLSRFVEAQTAQVIGGLNLVVPRQLKPKLIEFEHFRSARAGDVQSLFHCPVSFGHTANRIVFHQADLDLPLSTADAGLQAVLQRHCELVLANRPKDRPDIQVKVEKAIVDRIAQGQATVGVIAKDLGMSARTLARRLGDVGTTYQSILSNLRRALAERYLSDHSLSQSEIAYMLGYSDVSSFATAFKRWTGHSPGEQRHTRS
ncbi:AraC family transcriptional regulator [Shimia marina]|uniref:Virulence-regulating protein VirS n=1 Tax=Shimia marina TaxID=321267 RepID=A0A0P1ER45_9RHOB|nr:AraC family transcriptional regulator [Shimia marina]CUH52923.1 Virulence-regulating protein VirS [Shimia marina]SFD90248.1 AraC-type DNA-binding protein [Shimia marina]